MFPFSSLFTTTTVMPNCYNSSDDGDSSYDAGNDDDVDDGDNRYVSDNSYDSD